jgi:MFS family permease
MLQPFRNKKDRSLTYLHGEAVSSSVENAGINYQAPSLLSAGGQAKDVAILSTATNLIFALLLVKTPAFLKSEDSLKKATIILALISALAWLPLILVPFLVPGVSLLVLITLWVISLIPALLIGPIRDKWMADLLPSNRMGKYFGLRQIVAAGSYLTTFYLMGYLMDYSNIRINNTYTLVFSIAFLGSLISFLLYLVVRKSEVHAQNAPGGFGILDFLYETKQNNMSTFMVYVTLLIFSASISGAFFSVYMLQDLHFSYLTYTVIISVEFLARIFSLIFWGKIVDNAGAIKLLKLISFLIPVVPVMWLFSSNLYYLGAVQFISGISWAAFDLCNQTHISSASPESKRLHYIVYQRCIITIASAIGPLLGAFLLNRIFPVFGSQILSIFLLSGALRLLVVLTLVFKLKSSDSTKTTEQPMPSAVHTIYQNNQIYAETYRVFPRYTRPIDQPLSKNNKRPAIQSTVKAAQNATFQNGVNQTVSPYRNAQYNLHREEWVRMLQKKPTHRPDSGDKSYVHRLTHQTTAVHG